MSIVVVEIKRKSNKKMFKQLPIRRLLAVYLVFRKLYLVTPTFIIEPKKIKNP